MYTSDAFMAQPRRRQGMLMPSPTARKLNAGIVVLIAVSLFFCAPRGKRSAEKMDAVAAAPDTEALETYVYECKNERFTVQTLADTAWLYYDDTTVVLRRQPAASGAKYTGDGFVYWSKRDKARFEIPERSFKNCRMNKREASWEAARLRGVDFRALGQEPGWLLDLYCGDSIVFLADYATKRYVAPTPEPRVLDDGAVIHFSSRTNIHRLDVSIVRDSCYDPMSGFGFPATVTVTVDGNGYIGCGRALGEGGICP
ncbi:MAG: hypothetical protein GF344_02350 [Chitinivibrionales bacterium]|nr:hypothetical protein [Chitinivibrionales bacterium]MBD3355933.1 hypothetical protein [Chitinivibrionales bacterium]